MMEKGAMSHVIFFLFKANFFTSLNLNFPLYKVEIVVMITLFGYWED